MTYVFFALVAHCLNAVVFAVDKGLLLAKSSLSQPARYAALSGLVAGSTALLLLISFAVPSLTVIFWSLLGGLLWMGALLLFFTSLQQGEPTIVVPLTGSTVPLFTLVAAIIFLQEQLLPVHIAGVLLLILGGLLLSVHWSTAKQIPPSVIGIAILSGLLFALYFIVVKHLYSIFDPFLAALAYSRLGVALVALILFIFILLTQKSPSQRRRRHQLTRPTWIIFVTFVVSKGLAMIALILQNYAISLGSVTVVNALQGTQYIFLLAISAGIAHWWPAYQAKFTRVALIQKVIGILSISTGLAFLAL